MRYKIVLEHHEGNTVSVSRKFQNSREAKEYFLNAVKTSKADYVELVDNKLGQTKIAKTKSFKENLVSEQTKQQQPNEEKDVPTSKAAPGKKRGRPRKQ